MRSRPLRLAVLVLLLVVLAVLIIFVVVPVVDPPPPTLSPTFGPITGDNPLVETREMLFTSNRDGDWDVYVMALADRSVKNLTNNDFDDGFGSYSADGGAITFLSNRSGVLDAYMMNADGSDQRVVANDLPTIFSVISSGRLNWGINALDVNQAVFVSLRDLNLEIYTQDAEGEHNLTKHGAIDWFPAWSANADRIAFASDREDGNQEIFVMDANGNNPRRLTDAPGDDLYPMWWANTIYFFSDRDIPFADGEIGLYALNLDDANPQAQRVTDAMQITYLGAQRWAVDGSQLYLMNGDGDWDIYYADSVGRHSLNLTDNDADDLFPVWRPKQNAE
jgi:Tol biopolymer transport system component